jgi:hypothetical protein
MPAQAKAAAAPGSSRALPLQRSGQHLLDADDLAQRFSQLLAGAGAEPSDLDVEQQMLAGRRAVAAERQQAAPGKLLDDAGEDADLGNGTQGKTENGLAGAIGLARTLR